MNNFLDLTLKAATTLSTALGTAYMSYATSPTNESHNQQAQSYQKKPAQKRKTIPKALRLTVWNTYIGTRKRYGECCICRGNIENTNFECGHIISVANGGETTIDNLLPICSACNKSIGAENIPDFKRRYNY
jgi:hypothetical protein